MGIFARKNTLGATAVLALIGGLALGAGPAQASERPIDITGYQVADVVVSSSYCKKVMITATAKKQKDFTRSHMYVDIIRQGDIVHTVNFAERTLRERGEVCPYSTGLGQYTIGPADVRAEYKYKDSYGDWTTDSRDYWDTTKKDFNVRGHTKSSLAAKRSGTKVTLTASASFYSPENGRYAQYSPKNAKLQVKTGKSWKTIKTLKLNKGKASISLKDSKKKTYRVTVPKNAWAVATTTKAITK